MPIKIQDDLPAKEVLKNENIFVMDEKRALHQDIRPIQIIILNLMPFKEETELQLLRLLSNTPLQIDILFMMVTNHKFKNTTTSHLNKFYETFNNIKNNKFDGMIITGAPVEQMNFENVDYWKEFMKIMEWSKFNVTSTIYLCWAAQAGLYYHYGLKKKYINNKIFGVFSHKIKNSKIPLIRGFDDIFLAPHSRHTEISFNDIYNCDALTILAESKEVGVFLCIAMEGKQIFIMGHPEYDRMTLDKEYKRDKRNGINIKFPKNYYPKNDLNNIPLLLWKSHANNLYNNWLNYYVYQITPYNLIGTPF